MNKSDLVLALSARSGLSRADATKAIDTIFDAEGGLIADAMKSADKVQITGFGTFEAKRRSARTGRNPRTGEEIRIASTVSPVFRAGKALKDAVKDAKTE
jgi:DNA-binding protein HU-beta